MGRETFPPFLYSVQNGREYTKNVNGKYFMGAVRHQEGEYRMNYVDDMEREERKAEEWI